MRTTTGSATWAQRDPLRTRGVRTRDQPAGQARHRVVTGPGPARRLSRGGPRPLAARTARPARGGPGRRAAMTPPTRGRPLHRGAPAPPPRRTRPGQSRPGKLRLGMRRPEMCRAGMRRFGMGRAGVTAVELTPERVPRLRRRLIPAWSGRGRPVRRVPRRRLGPSCRRDLPPWPSLSWRPARAEGVPRSPPARACPRRSGGQTPAGQRGWMRPPCATRGPRGSGLTIPASPAGDRRSGRPGFGPRARRPRRGPSSQRPTPRKRTRRRGGGPSARRQTPSHLGWPARQRAAWLTLAMRGPHCPFPAWLSRWPLAVR